MCSMKWVIPSRSTGSSRAPLLSHTPIATDPRSASRSVSSVIPDGSTVFWYSPAVMRWPRRGLAASSSMPCGGPRPAARMLDPGSAPAAAVPVASTTIPVAPAVPIAMASATTSAAARGARHRAFRLGEQRLARELDLSVAIDADDLDHHRVPDVEHVFRARDAVVIDLGDVQEAVTPRHDLDEGAEGHHAAHAALIDLPDLRVLGDVANQLLGATARFPADRGDPHLARVLDVDL